MVCLGNICRSPLAEGIMATKVKEHGLDWHIESAGTGSWHIGEPPDPRSVDVALKNGIDITYQRARQFRPYDLEEFDRIYAMDVANYNDILKHAESEEEKDKVIMILNELYPGENRQVPDPYFGEHGFDKVFDMLNEACDTIIEKEIRD